MVANDAVAPLIQKTQPAGTWPVRPFSFGSGYVSLSRATGAACPFDREEIASGGAAGWSAAISLSLSDGQSLGGCDYGSVPLLSRMLIGSPVRASVAGSDPELAVVDRSVHANAGRPRHLEARVRLAVKGDPHGARRSAGWAEIDSIRRSGF
jgi:hypothetical protein